MIIKSSRKIPLDEMSLEQLRKQARKFSRTTRPIKNYARLGKIDLYREILDRWADVPVDVLAVRL